MVSLSLSSSSFSILSIPAYSRSVVFPITFAVPSIILSSGLSYTSDVLPSSKVPSFLMGTLFIILI